MGISKLYDYGESYDKIANMLKSTSVVSLLYDARLVVRRTEL